MNFAPRTAPKMHQSAGRCKESRVCVPVTGINANAQCQAFKSGVVGVSQVCIAGKALGQAMRDPAGDAVEGVEAGAEEDAAEQAGPQPVAGVQPGTDMLGDVKTFQVLWHAASTLSTLVYACSQPRVCIGKVSISAGKVESCLTCLVTWRTRYA